MRKNLGWFLLLAAIAPSLSSGWVRGQNGEIISPGPNSETPIPRSLPSLGAGAPFVGGDVGPLDVPVSGVAELNDNFQKLKEVRQALQEECVQVKTMKDSVSPFSSENAKLRLRLGEILSKLNAPAKTPIPEIKKPRVPVKQEKPVKAPKSGKQEEKGPGDQNKTAPTVRPAESARPLDPLALAQALFKAESYEGALKAYRLVDLKGMKAEERCPIQYMMATCLKRIGKMDEAASQFREIANARGDENMAVCAQWQLSAIRWKQEMGNRLNDIRQRRKMLEEQHD